MQSVRSVFLSQVEAEAVELASTLKGGEVLALIGDLGSGKTTFVQHLGKAMGVKQKILSPTFILMQEYPTNISNLQDQAIWLNHLDLYRVDKPQDIATLGLDQLFGNKQVVLAIEWADRIKEFLPNNTTIINFYRD